MKIILEKHKLEPIDTGWILAELPQDINDIAYKLIQKEDLDLKNGIDDKPHITIRGYLNKEKIDLNEFYRLFLRIKSFYFNFDRVDFFDNPNYDILIYRVSAPELEYIRNLIEFKFDCHEDPYPNFNPHCTIAYLKKGMGKKYVEIFSKHLEKKKKIADNNLLIKIDKISYSQTDKQDGEYMKIFFELKS